MSDATRAHWMPVFLAAAIDPEAPAELLRRGARRWSLQDLRPPTRRTFGGLLGRVRSTSPGPDGLPYAMRGTRAQTRLQH